jgi:hypothetical protein
MTRLSKLSSLFLSLSLLLALVGEARGGKFSELIKKADMANRGQTSAAVMQMEIKTSSYQRSFRMVVWSDDRGKEKVLVKILGPALWRGHGTLKIGDQLKLYNPKQNHITVVGHSMLGDAWMGSHFTNDDLVKETRLERHFEARLLKRWTADSPLGQAAFYRFELTPKPSAPVVWEKVVYVVLEKGEVALPLRAEYFRKAKQKKPTRWLVFDEIKQMGGRPVTARMTVKVQSKPGEYTRLSYRKLRFDIDLPRSKFTEQALRR